MSDETLPLLAFAAPSGSGKTTLLERLIPRLRARGLRVGLIKHSHHSFDIDHPGKDSYRLREAGASQVMVASRRRWALITEHDDDRPEPDLQELLDHIDMSNLDLILVEGFKHEAVPKVEIHRPSLGTAPLYPDNDTIIAIATDAEQPLDTDLPQLDLNDIETIADFVVARCLSTGE